MDFTFWGAFIGFQLKIIGFSLMKTSFIFLWVQKGFKVLFWILVLLRIRLIKNLLFFFLFYADSRFLKDL